jgi:hypothetical protein
MTTQEQKATYTQQQAEELERALEAQYLADGRAAPPADEYAAWQRVRRAVALRRFDRARPGR